MTRARDLRSAYLAAVTEVMGGHAGEDKPWEELQPAERAVWQRMADLLHEREVYR